MEFKRADAGDRTLLEQMLKEAGLPFSDLQEVSDFRFWKLSESGGILGFMGLEAYGDTALLRSAVVAPGHRSRGLGAQLLSGLEAACREQGITTLVLLTETAEKFFARHGFQKINRSDVPAAAQQSPEFRHACPASAAAMVKYL